MANILYMKKHYPELIMYVNYLREMTLLRLMQELESFIPEVSEQSFVTQEDLDRGKALITVCRERMYSPVVDDEIYRVQTILDRFKTSLADAAKAGMNRVAIAKDKDIEEYLAAVCKVYGLTPSEIDTFISQVMEHSIKNPGFNLNEVENIAKVLVSNRTKK